MKSRTERCSTPLLCKLTVLSVVVLTLVEMIAVNQWEKSYLVFNLAFFEISKNMKSPTIFPHMTNINDSFTSKTTSLAETSATDVQLQLRQKLLNAAEKKVILVWIPMPSSQTTPAVNISNCGNCEVTYDRKRINDSNTGAVVFHFHAIKQNNTPFPRNSKQLYIFWAKESTANIHCSRNISLKFEDDFMFNATMTYRRDSEFYMNYEYPLIPDIVQKNTIPLTNLLKMKTKTAVVVVSNCNKKNGATTRINLLRELMKLVHNMEGYGKCFNSSGFAGGHRHQTNRFTQEIRKYKFYFAFENSYHCKDYITEKFFRNALKSYAVPVVWGAKKEDYEAVAPPGSFIFAEDFTSMKHLAEYLNYLLKNETAYLEYLRWIIMKPSDMPQHGRARGWCQICRALHGINIDDKYNPKYNATHPERPLFTDDVAKRSVFHLSKWFYGEENQECFNTCKTLGQVTGLSAT